MPAYTCADEMQGLLRWKRLEKFLTILQGKGSHGCTFDHYMVLHGNFTLGETRREQLVIRCFIDTLAKEHYIWHIFQEPLNHGFCEHCSTYHINCPASVARFPMRFHLRRHTNVVLQSRTVISLLRPRVMR